MNNKFQKTRIAMLTPSSNSIVEPWCYRIIGSLDNATVHFGRVEVLRIDNKEDSLAQFHDENMLKSFDLLSHVKPMVIGWNGTSASWLGFNRDRILIELIKKNFLSSYPTKKTSPNYEPTKVLFYHFLNNNFYIFRR